MRSSNEKTGAKLRDWATPQQAPHRLIDLCSRSPISLSKMTWRRNLGDSNNSAGVGVLSEHQSQADDVMTKCDRRRILGQLRAPLLTIPPQK